MAIKKLLLFLLIVPLVFFIQSCGKGANEGYISPGSGQGSPVYIKLKPSRYAAQTNGCIEFYAEVHDAQGELLANIPVQFTNLSEPFGQLLDRCGGTEINPPVRINTDSWGRARVTLYSTTPGFASILASTDIGEQPRDRKTVMFQFCSTYDCLVLAPSVQLDVDSEPPDGILNEAGDFIIFDPLNLPDDKANLWATVRNEYGVLIPYNAHLVWGSDHAEATFTRTETWTNENGQATAQVEFIPSSLRGTETHVNVWVYSDNVSSFVLPMGIVTFFLQPVYISSIDVSADPSVVDPEADSTITATVWLNTGDLAFDGIPVTFTSCLCEDPPDCNTCTDPCGFVDPLSMTTGGTGQATSTLTAPPVPGTCMVTARANGVTGSTNVLVTTELTVMPDNFDINGTFGGTATYTIYGGVAPYTIISDSVDPNLQPDPATVDNSGDTFEVVVPAGTADVTVTYTIRDAVGTEVTATLTITVEPLDVIPDNNDINGTVGGTATFTINGGLPGYTITSDDPNLLPAPPTVTNTGDTFTVTVPAGTAPTTATYTIRDTEGTEVTATVTVSVNPLTIVPSSVPVDGTGPYDVLTFTITDGVPPYTVQSSDVLSACNDLNDNHNCGGADTDIWNGTLMNGDTIDVTVPAGTATTTVTLTVTDSDVGNTTATLNIVGP